MSTASGEALELALALQRMPAQRHALRERPLPDDIGRLLPIAAGSAEPLAQAASDTGEPPQRVLEAVRFYLQEMLFFADADAYRVLGLTPAASEDQLRLHHRQLQRWLHPDRLGDDWESVFATRVNQAWHQLRDPQRRREYDAKLESGIAENDPQPATDTADIAAPIPTMAWHREAPDRRQRLWRAAPVLLLVLACLVLAFQLARRSDDAALQDWAAVDEGDPHASTVPPAAIPASPVPAATVRPTRVPAVRPAPVADVAAARPQLQPLLPIVPDAAVRDAAAADAPMPAVAVAPARPDAPVATRKPAAVERIDASRRVASVRPAPHAPATIEPAAIVATRRPPAPPQAIAKPQPASDAPTSVAMPDLPPPDPLEQVRLARARASTVAGYLSDPQAPSPPVWIDASIRARAEDLRRSLQSEDRSGRIVLQDPDWRISSNQAVLEAGWRRERWFKHDEQGVLRLQLVWRNGRWLVQRLDVERRQ